MQYSKVSCFFVKILVGASTAQHTETVAPYNIFVRPASWQHSRLSLHPRMFQLEHPLRAQFYDSTVFNGDWAEA
jgi:hypothetical protein